MFRIRRGLHRTTKAAERVVPETGLIASKPKTRDSGNELPLSKHAIALLEEHRTLVFAAGAAPAVRRDR